LVNRQIIVIQMTGKSFPRITKGYMAVCLVQITYIKSAFEEGVM